jgi:DNA-binding SARP family transcriptional activator/tetratricopeptide (TPR) repeat protein
MALEIDLLGRFAVRRDGHEVAQAEFGGRRVRRLLRLLAAQQGQVLTREVLIEALWEQHAPADPDANLNVLINRARRALSDPALIETVSGGYVFRAGPSARVDGERLESCVRRAREGVDRGNPGGALVAAQEALAAWHGEPLPEDTYADWARPYRDRLLRAHQEALEIGASAALAIGDAQRAADLAAEAVSRQPLREIAHVLLIRALAAGGDKAAALAAYEQLRRRLAEELGIDPSREAAEVHLRLLRDQLPPAEPLAPVLVKARAGAPPPFVGREAELEHLARLGRDAHVALVAGRSGSGKSRLLAELDARSDRPVLSARAVLPERMAPWSLARALLQAAADAGAEAVRQLPHRTAAAMAELLPEGAAPTTSPAVLDSQTRRALTLEGAARMLQAAGTALILVDDLQWADASSLDVLALVAARAHDLALVFAYRPEEIGHASEVARFIADLQTGGHPLEVRLGRLPPVAIGRLVADPALAALLAEHTDGMPFAVLEMIRDLEAQGVLRRDGSDVWHVTAADALDRARASARAGQLRSILVRTSRQPQARRQLLDLLAVLGRPASARLLAEATGATESDIIDQLRGLIHAELARHEGRGFTVAHDLVGETLRDELEPVDRAHLHQLLARALQHQTTEAGERARHLAGAGDGPAAVLAYTAAAREQLDRFADREASRLADAGLGLDPADGPRVDLLEIRAETRARTGDLARARTDLREALTLAAPGAARSRLLARLAALAAGAEDLLRAANLIELALVEAGDDPVVRARALYVGAIVDMNLKYPSRARARYVEAMRLFEQVNDARGVTDILDARAMAVFLDGDIDNAIEAFDRVARLFTDAGNLLRAVTPRSTRGHGLVFAGKPAEGLADAGEALALARSLGSLDGEAMAQWHRSEALSACGCTAEAAQAAAAALSIAERVGHRGWTAGALRAVGIVRQADGDLHAAEAAFRRSLQASEHFPLIACWAHARLGLVLVGIGRFTEAADHIRRALLAPPALGHYEGRLARCELAIAREEPQAPALLDDAINRASRSGHRASLPRLAALRQSAGG